jgi:hypothetical protein
VKARALQAAEISPASFGGHRTARTAVEMLCAADPRYRCPTRAERDALLVGFAKHRMTLNGAAFDAVRLERDVDLADPEHIASDMDAITICEVKSTNRVSLKADLRGYFFNITAAELLTAQSLGDRYRFVFLNTVTGDNTEMVLTEVFSRARGLYPAWHIRF